MKLMKLAIIERVTNKWQMNEFYYYCILKWSISLSSFSDYMHES